MMHNKNSRSDHSYSFPSPAILKRARRQHAPKFAQKPTFSSFERSAAAADLGDDDKRDRKFRDGDVPVTLAVALATTPDPCRRCANGTGGGGETSGARSGATADGDGDSISDEDATEEDAPAF